MSPVMDRCMRVKQNSCKTSCIAAFAICRAIKLAILLPLIAPVLYAQAAPPVQQLLFRPYHGSGMYNVGDTVGWIVSRGPTAPTYAYKWTIRRNNRDVQWEWHALTIWEVVAVIAMPLLAVYLRRAPIVLLRSNKSSLRSGPAAE